MKVGCQASVARSVLVCGHSPTAVRLGSRGSLRGLQARRAVWPLATGTSVVFAVSAPADDTRLQSVAPSLTVTAQVDPASWQLWRSGVETPVREQIRKPVQTCRSPRPEGFLGSICVPAVSWGRAVGVWLCHCPLCPVLLAGCTHLLFSFVP